MAGLALERLGVVLTFYLTAFWCLGCAGVALQGEGARVVKKLLYFFVEDGFF